MASLVARHRVINAFRQPNMFACRFLSTATVADHKLHSQARHAEPHHAAQTHVAHIAHGTIEINKFQLKPEVREVELLKMSREVMPSFVGTVRGAWGVPGPRSFLFENHHNEWNYVGLWESASAMEAFKKSPEHDKLMQKFGSLIDVGESKTGGEVCDADFHYYEPMRQCNWERYTVEVSEWNVKPGFRQHVQKLITENKSVVAWCHDIGLHFQVLKYNATETRVVSYNVYRDLLKWEAGQGQMEKNIADWGLASFLVEDLTKKELPRQTNAHIHHTQSGTLHTNAWVFSQ